jgi:hypothetical protein
VGASGAPWHPVLMSAPRRRRLGPCAAALVASALVVTIAATAQAAIVLTPTRRVSGPTSWTVGNGLGRSNAYLHTVWASDCPPPKGACATDQGPYVGVFWQRSPLTRVPGWGKAKRISRAGTHAVRPSVAASGSHVYVAWVTQTSYLKYRPRAPRRVWIRVGRQQGSSWAAPLALTGAHGRADYPVVAAAGDAVWVVWTAADSGAIRMASSPDAGATWTTVTIGHTVAGRGTAEGYAGFPAIGAAGTNVVAAWFANRAGKQVALTSSTGGDDWSAASPTTPISGTSPNDGNRYPVVRGASDGMSDRVAIGYTTATGVATRVFDGAALSGQVLVDGPWPVHANGRRWAGAYGVAAQPFGTDGLAVAYAACRPRKGADDPCRPNAKGARIDTVYRESPDAGATWSNRRIVAGSSHATRVNEAVSVEADGTSGDRWFTWLGRSTTWTRYRVLGRAASSG